MDPFSAFSLGGALADIVADAKTKEVVYSVHNKSSAKLRFALCSSYSPDDLNTYFSTGWTEVDGGETHGKSLHIPRSGTYMGIYVQYAKDGAQYLSDGGFRFYVLDKSLFLIKQARTRNPLPINCSGRPELVSGHVHLIKGNFAFTIS